MAIFQTTQVSQYQNGTILDFMRTRMEVVVVVTTGAIRRAKL